MVSRRTFLKTMIMAGSVTAVSGIVPGINAVVTTPLRVRRDISKMALNDPDLETYRDFIQIMRSKDQAQLLSWLGFASQHGSKQMSKYCPHGNWYFLPWHRGFMEMYEQAAIVLTGNPSFALPYWDWALDSARSLPAAFRVKTYNGKPNPLYVPYNPDRLSGYPVNQDTDGNRFNATAIKEAITDNIVGATVMNEIFQETVFEAFGSGRNALQTDYDPKWIPIGGGLQGRLEATPHNTIHDAIGAFMPNMNSPCDPIFLLHHGKIDQLWANWNALGRKNPGVYDPLDPTNSKYPNCDPNYPHGALWFNMPFTNNFISPTGQLYTKKVSDLVEITDLGYTYDKMPYSNISARKASHINTQERDQHLLAIFDASVKSNPKRFQANKFDNQSTATIVLDYGTLDSVASPFSSSQSTHTQEVIALISDIDIGDNVLAIQVFVNRETVPSNTSASSKDPHYVTTLSFLRHGSGADHQHPHSLPSTMVNITKVLINLAKTKGISGDIITIQLFPVPRDKTKPVGRVIPKQIEITVV